MAYASLKCLEMSSTPVPRLSARDAAPAPTAFHPSHAKLNTSKLSKSYCGRILIISYHFTQNSQHQHEISYASTTDIMMYPV